jgi:hypothetical protein
MTGHEKALCALPFAIPAADPGDGVAHRPLADAEFERRLSSRPFEYRSS